jgi:hypothetical protein
MRKTAHGLFLNTTVANCSIYESGLMVKNALQKYANSFTIDYQEISKYGIFYNVGREYDFYVINWHPAVLNASRDSINSLPGKKIAVVLETLPNNPFPVTPPDWFNSYMVLDPTQKRTKNVYPFPRPLEIVDNLPPLLRDDIPVIGSFGFFTPGKKFEEIIEIYSNNRKQCIIRLNIPNNTYTTATHNEIKLRKYIQFLQLQVKQRPNIDLRITQNYMSKEELVRWCSQNTINSFPYYRNLTGLSAVTDQAISAGRPIAITNCETFRHLRPYISYFPEQSYEELIKSTLEGVKRMQEDWNPHNFEHVFEGLLVEQRLL